MQITRVPLPVRQPDLPDTITGGWLPYIEGLQKEEIVAQLRTRWSSFEQSYLTRLAQTILRRHLTCFAFDNSGLQWLSFEDPRLADHAAVHLAATRPIPATLRSQFPFERIAGLAEFMENFAGLANCSLPPCPWFVPFEDCRVVSDTCDTYDWGVTGKWAGSLTLYNTGTGNFIVVSPDNVCAKWDHDIGWGGADEDPFEDLHWTMSELVERFVEFLSLDESAARQSPFYY